MSTQRLTIFSRVRQAWNTLSNRAESPRVLQERHDLYKIILSAMCRNLRRERLNILSYSSKLKETENNIFRPDQSKNESKLNISSGESYSYLCHLMREIKENTSMSYELEKIVDEASISLQNDMQIHTVANKILRQELQKLYSPELNIVFNAFQKVDQIIPHLASSESSSLDTAYDAVGDETHVFCRNILVREHRDLMHFLNGYDLKQQKQAQMNKNNYNDREINDNTTVLNSSYHVPFLMKKKSAIESILKFKGWYDEVSLSYNDNVSSNSDEMKEDEFGYRPVEDEEVNEGIRYHQMINLTRAVLLRQDEIGYSTIALKSSITPGTVAGRGIFVDGYAPAGSFVAFFPGAIWPKECLLDVDGSTSVFKDDPNFQLSMRYDDILIDSRKSPYTVISGGDHSNPFAIAHIANHPPRGVTPNCWTTMIDYHSTRIDGGGSLEKYVPNTYARPPKLIGPNLFDGSNSEGPIFMHGFGLVASRDICNEELYYDYRLSPGKFGTSYPDWYHEFDKTNRWTTE